MRLGFIGCGNMGGAMVSGILKKQLLASEDMIASALHEESRKALREKFGITVTSDNSEVAAFSDILILAVKPQSTRKSSMKSGKLVQPIPWWYPLLRARPISGLRNSSAAR